MRQLREQFRATRVISPECQDDQPQHSTRREPEHLIRTRTADLTERAVREHPAWMSMLGQPPRDDQQRAEWLRNVAVIAAYRDQRQITTNDPRQILGPYPETRRHGHEAYWHAAESVLAARRVSGLDQPAPRQRSMDPLTEKVATDVYRSLPKDERVDIAEAVARRTGTLWLGDRSQPDEDATAQPAYAGHLAAELAARKHISPPAPHRTRSRVTADEPVEASLAKRMRPDGPSEQRRAARTETGTQRPQIQPQQYETRQNTTGPVAQR